MGIIQHLYYYIILLLVAYSFYLNMLIIIDEIKLRGRKNINYQNFNKQKQMYQFKYNKQVLLGFVAYIILSAVFSLVLFSYKEYHVYIYLLGFLEIILIMGLILHISSSRYDKDLSLYEEYYKIIEDSFENREKLISNIHQLEQTYKNLDKEGEDLIQYLKTYVPEFSHLTNYLDTISPLKDVIEAQIDIKNGFDYNITNKFNDALKLYLKTGQTINLNVSKFKFVDTTSLQTILDLIKENQKKVLTKYVEEELDISKFTSLIHLRLIVNKFNELEVSFGKEKVIDVLNVCHIFLESREPLIDLLYQKKLISVDIICDIINKNDWDWAYSQNMNTLFEANDLVKMVQSMIQHNSNKCSMRYLSSEEGQSYSIINQALEEEKTDNETRSTYLIYSHLLSSDQLFFKESTKYENMAMILKEYGEDYVKKESVDQTVFDEVNEIITNQTFDVNGSKIESTYSTYVKKMDSIIKPTVDTMLLFMNSNVRQLKYIDNDKLIRVYSEYKRNLNIKELMTLNQLLQSFILKYDVNPNHIQKVFTHLSTSKLPINQSEINFNNRDKLGNELLANLLSNKGFVKVVNRIENNRLLLDELKKI